MALFSYEDVVANCPPVNNVIDISKRLKGAKHVRIYTSSYCEATVENVKAALTYLDPDNYTLWVATGIGLYRWRSDDVGFDIFDEWSARCKRTKDDGTPIYSREDCRQKWDNDIANAPVRDIKNATINSVFNNAKALGWPDPVHGYVEALNRQYVHDRETKQIYDIKYDRFRTKSEFQLGESSNIITVPTGEKVLAVTLWLADPNHRQHEGVRFMPGEQEITESGHYNTWKGFGCTPRKGNVSLFYGLINHLITDADDRRFVLQWIAWYFQHPDKKLATSIIMWSKMQGSGKSLLWTLIGELHGERYYNFIKNTDLEGQFNWWAVDKTLIVGEEIALSHKREITDKLKDLISGGLINVNMKHQPNRKINNTTNFVFLSNKPQPLYIEQEDRRFYCVHAAEERYEPELAAQLLTWFHEELGKDCLLYHFQNEIDMVGFSNQTVPKTKEKEKMQELGMSGIESFVDELIRDLDGPAIIPFKSLLGKLQDLDRFASHKSLGNVLLSRGCIKRDLKLQNTQVNTRIYAIRDMALWEERDNKQWKEEAEKWMR